VFCPRTKMAVFSFSTSLGSRSSSARFTRAFFGFLHAYQSVGEGAEWVWQVWEASGVRCGLWGSGKASAQTFAQRGERRTLS
jgi:hypothetical protein